MYLLNTYCQDLFPILKIFKSAITILQILIPIGLLIFGAIDLGKAVIAGKEDEMKKAQGTLIKRVIYAVAVFLLFTIITLVMNVVAGSGVDGADNDWRNCWVCAGEKNADAYNDCMSKQ